MAADVPIVPADELAGRRSGQPTRAMRMLVVVALLGAVLLPPSAASAHGGGEHGGITSTVDRIEPELGLEASASGDGHFTLTVPEGATVVVHGTREEPERRFANGVVVERTATGWRRIATGTTATWHDHRTQGPGYQWISYLALGGGALYVAYVLVARRRARS